ncbi:hypothetical protein [Prauserella muralis]|uniref:Uncharacterized protein n=1 Tax=Prauserella muralis TaxID=588067 RepID=A0A2V4BDM7_9PSEU|nr:hypothetical protein [Prauserella muralis]PXY32169.1 hypothetical protein BAY60_07720 [Prauserella muralis]TWE24175.1 Mce-associated membrane protein [Prauserella muralis]
MPPSRRIPGASEPSRRPRVAGLRKPAGPSVRPARPRPEPQEPEETPEVTETAEPETASAEPVEEAEQAEQAGEPADEPAAPKPGPRRKARDTGTPKPESEDDLAEATPSERTERQDGARGRGAGRGYAAVAVLLVLAVVFSGLAVLFKYRHSEVSAATDNTALIDVAATAQVKDAMSSAAERLFSIDYNDIGKTEKAADELLVNDEVRKTYDALMSDVRKRAPEQKIVVTVKATRSAVVALEDDRAKVMVYIDQTATRTQDNQTSAGSAALWFITEKRDDQWKVTNMDTYTAGQPAPTPAPGRQAPPASGTGGSAGN